MGISFRNDFLNPERVQFRQSLRKSVVETSTGRKSVTPNSITAETGVDKGENDRLLRKVQFAQTKADALREYFGAMQEAVRGSGSGLVMYRRVGHMTGTAKAFQQTDEFKNKKEEDTFIIDQLEALKKRQEEIQELREQQKENQQDTAVSENNSRRVANEQISAKKDTSQQNITTNKNTVKSAPNIQNTDTQRKAAAAYKSKDAPARNPYVQEFFTGMM